jgi:hypothetical protein
VTLRRSAELPAIHLIAIVVGVPLLAGRDPRVLARRDID